MAVLTAAAVAARPVVGGLMQAVVEQSDEAFEEAARLLISRQFMRRDVIGGYRIAHDGMREWVYARIPETDRRALHVRVLRALEATGLTDDDTVYASAHHAWHGRDLRARALNADAAARAQARYSTDLAVVCYERAIALTDEAAEPAFAMTLHERLADVAFLSASYSRALTGYEQALRLGQGLGDEVRLRRRIGDTLSKTGWHRRTTSCAGPSGVPGAGWSTPDWHCRCCSNATTFRGGCCPSSRGHSGQPRWRRGPWLARSAAPTRHSDC